MHNAIIAESDAIIKLPNLERKVEGRRLLGVSGECIRRVFYAFLRLAHYGPTEIF